MSACAAYTEVNASVISFGLIVCQAINHFGRTLFAEGEGNCRNNECVSRKSQSHVHIYTHPFSEQWVSNA